MVPFVYPSFYVLRIRSDLRKDYDSVRREDLLDLHLHGIRYVSEANRANINVFKRKKGETIPVTGRESP
jgi:hypothetical protein